MDIREFKNCMGRFATGVTVVTCNTHDGKHGLTANAFTSVSLDPPLILISIDRKTRACEYLNNNNFTVNILKGDQQSVARHFAGRPQETLPCRWVEGEFAPRFEHSLAYFECTPWREYDGGDHVLFIGEVKDFQYCEEDEALTFYSGKFSNLPVGAV